MTDVLDIATAHAKAYLETLRTRPIGATATVEEMRLRLARALPETGMSPEAVVDDLVRDTEGGLMGSNSGRFFGWVIGGTLPVAIAADLADLRLDQQRRLSSIISRALVRSPTPRTPGCMSTVPSASGSRRASDIAICSMEWSRRIPGPRTDINGSMCLSIPASYSSRIRPPTARPSRKTRAIRFLARSCAIKRIEIRNGRAGRAVFRVRGHPSAQSLRSVDGSMVLCLRRAFDRGDRRAPRVPRSSPRRPSIRDWFVSWQMTETTTVRQMR